MTGGDLSKKAVGGVQQRPRSSSGQTFIEYTLLLSIVIMGLVMLNPIMRRTTQSLVRLVADQIGNQRQSDQTGGESGYMLSSLSQASVDHTKTVTERLGSRRIDYFDTEITSTNQVSNLGFTETE